MCAQAVQHREAEVSCDEEQVFLMKLQAQLSKQPATPTAATQRVCIDSLTVTVYAAVARVLVSLCSCNNNDNNTGTSSLSQISVVTVV